MFDLELIESEIPDDLVKQTLFLAPKLFVSRIDEVRSSDLCVSRTKIDTEEPMVHRALDG